MTRPVRALNYKLRHSARAQLTRARKSGQLIPPERCQGCRRTGRTLTGHHTDYKYPLKVTWLCVACHKKEHTEQPAAGTPGAELRRLREQAGATQRALAKAADVHARAIIRWERNQVPLSKLQALGLAALFAKLKTKETSR